MRIRIAIVLALLGTLILPQTANATQPDRCRSILKQGIIYTSCWSGHMALTYHTGSWRITEWRHRMDPTFKVTCKGRITRAIQPVPLCSRPPMHTFGI